jgi:hypothetical protein
MEVKNPAYIATPPKSGIGFLFIFLQLGLSSQFIFKLIDRTNGVNENATTVDIKKAVICILNIFN